MDRKSQVTNAGEWIEEKKVVIGLVLFLFVLASGGYLIWRESYWKPSTTRRIEDLESKVKLLEEQSQISENKKEGVEIVASDSAGIVAGTTSDNQTSEANDPLAPQKLPDQTEKKDSPAVSGTININTASASQLDALPGIGPVLSQRIIDYRSTSGLFQSREQIKNVKGIGESVYSKIQDKIFVE